MGTTIDKRDLVERVARVIARDGYSWQDYTLNAEAAITEILEAQWAWYLARLDGTTGDELDKLEAFAKAHNLTLKKEG